MSLLILIIFPELISFASAITKTCSPRPITKIYPIFGLFIIATKIERMTSQQNTESEIGSTLFCMQHKNINTLKSISGKIIKNTYQAEKEGMLSVENIANAMQASKNIIVSINNSI